MNLLWTKPDVSGLAGCAKYFLCGWKLVCCRYWHLLYETWIRLNLAKSRMIALLIFSPSSALLSVFLATTRRWHDREAITDMGADQVGFRPDRVRHYLLLGHESKRDGRVGECARFLRHPDRPAARCPATV